MASSRTQLYARFLTAQTKRKPPKGYRHAQNEMRSGAGYQPPPLWVPHDGSPSPKGTGPFRRPRRGQTKPTPGSTQGRRSPWWN